VFTRIEPKRTRVKSQLSQQLGQLLETEKKTRPVKLARNCVASKAADLLFRELVKELSRS